MFRFSTRFLVGALAPMLLCCQATAGQVAPQAELAAPRPPIRTAGPPVTPRPLVVLVVVDQLRADLLDRYSSLFQGGLRRLHDEGLRFPNATHDHGITETAPGHATIATGVHPSKHGIVSNLWWEREDGNWRRVDNVVDDTAPIIEDRSWAGASPRKLERSGFADWLLQAHPEGRVVSLSAKDRAAVLMAGKSRGNVFWFDSQLGRFVTSLYYGKEYPLWVQALNQGVLSEYLADSVWTSTVPGWARGLSRPDTAAYEGDGVHTAFPHAITDTLPNAGRLPGFFDWLSTTPALDRLVLTLARMAVRGEAMGSDEVPDFLALSLSQTDRIGHPYGPLSREQMDNLLRLDQELGSFLQFLDDFVGWDRYSVLFTGDHGVLTNPEHLRELGEEGRRLEAEDIRSLEQILGEVVRQEARGGDGAVAKGLAERARSLDWIAQAWVSDELMAGEPADSFAVLMRHALFPGRPAGILSRYGVEIMLEPNTLIGWRRGTTHGSPYYYDRAVPLILMGAGIEPGIDPRKVATVDVAPTLAVWAGVPAPEDLDGTALVR